VVIAVLAVVVVLFVLANAAGARQPSGGLGSAADLPSRLGAVLVQPAGDGDVRAVDPACRQGHELAVAPGHDCLYRLQTGFLGRKLHLRLDAGTTVTAVVVQPKPTVTDTEALDAGHRRVDVVYKQDGSTLTLSCAPKNGPPCQVRVV
jgi:hypothetical protein